MNHYKITTTSHKGYIHYYIDDNYLGMFVFPKGEVSDFRAIIRKNKLEVNNGNLYANIEMALYELLNQYIYEHLFLAKEELQTLKIQIVNDHKAYLEQVCQSIIQNKGLHYDS